MSKFLLNLKTYGSKILAHLAYWKESYIYFPVFIVLTGLAIYGVNYLTGRPVIDSPEVIVGYFYNAIAILIAGMLTGMLQAALFAYRSKHHDDPTLSGSPSFRDDVFDAIIGVFLFSVILYAIWH